MLKTVLCLAFISVAVLILPTESFHQKRQVERQQQKVVIEDAPYAETTGVKQVQENKSTGSKKSVQLVINKDLSSGGLSKITDKLRELKNLVTSKIPKLSGSASLGIEKGSSIKY